MSIDVEESKEVQTNLSRSYTRKKSVSDSIHIELGFEARLGVVRGKKLNCKDLDADATLYILKEFYLQAKTRIEIAQSLNMKVTAVNRILKLFKTRSPSIGALSIKALAKA